VGSGVAVWGPEPVAQLTQKMTDGAGGVFGSVPLPP